MRWDWDDLSGEQIEKIHQAFLDGFRAERELERFLLLKMDLHLNHIAGGRTYSDKVLDLIRHAISLGRIRELCVKALRSIPGNARLRSLGDTANITVASSNSASGTNHDVLATKAKARHGLAPIWNLSLGRNSVFTGRAETLSKLHESLNLVQGQSRVHVIAGMGGVGKTQIAREYAYRHGKGLEALCWVNSETPEELLKNYAALARDVGVATRDDELDVRDAVERVRRWFENTPNTLLIFDNVEHPEQLREYLPRVPHCRVIVTSRNSHWPGFKITCVKVWSRKESLEHFRRTTGIDDASLDAVAEVLGDLPLGIAQASAYIRQTSIKPSDYETLLVSRCQELWKDEIKPDDYHATLDRTWRVTQDQLDPEAFELVGLLSLLAPEPVPRELFLRRDSLSTNRAVRALRDYSLVDASDKFLVVHRLVQQVVRHQLSEVQKREFLSEFGAMLRPVLNDLNTPQLDVDNQWELVEQLEPHVQRAAEECTSLSLKISEFDAILDRVKYLRLSLDLLPFYLDGRRDFVSDYLEAVGYDTSAQREVWGTLSTRSMIAFAVKQALAQSVDAGLRFSALLARRLAQDDPSVRSAGLIPVKVGFSARINFAAPINEDAATAADSYSATVSRLACYVSGGGAVTEADLAALTPLSAGEKFEILCHSKNSEEAVQQLVARAIGLYQKNHAPEKALVLGRQLIAAMAKLIADSYPTVRHDVTLAPWLQQD